MSDRFIELERLIQSDQAAGARILEGLVEEFYADLYHLAITILRNHAEAEDAAQESLIIASTRLHQYQPGTNLRAWLYTIVVNICRGNLRKRRTRRAIQKLLQVSSPSDVKVRPPEEAALKNEIEQQLWKAVNALSEKHRLPILLRYIYDLSIREIAQILGINEGTVRSRLHYGVRKLQAQFSGSGIPFTIRRKIIP